MSTLYDVEVRRLARRSVDLFVEPTQPDCCPFYLTARFAVGVLADAPPRRIVTRHPARRLGLLARAWTGHLLRSRRLWNREVLDNHRVDHHPLRAALGDAYCDIGSAETIDCARYIEDVRVLEVSGSRWNYDVPHPWAVYRFTVTRRAWIAHLSKDARWGSVAYDEVEPTPYLNLMEPRTKGPVIGGPTDAIDDPAFVAAFD